jgi:hypothetical protein
MQSELNQGLGAIKAGITNKYDRVVALRKEAISQVKSLRSSTELQHQLIESPHLAQQKQLKDTDKVERQTPDLSEFNKNQKGLTAIPPPKKDKEPPKDGELF